MAIQIRKDAWKLAKWDPILLWYAKAVRDMQGRAIKTSTSWRYQAAIHEYNPASLPAPDPPAQLPPLAEQQKYWTRCQHVSWAFLPWHRWYLFYFERIVAATVLALGGPSDWALPYWNYSDASNQDAMRLPPAFASATMPDGSANPLFVVSRARGNNGGFVGRPVDVDLSTCLTEPDYPAASTGGGGGFGGPKKFQHAGQLGDPVGELERVPHGSMHNRVGGFMADFTLAALDPIFWLHHANIDRLWVVWLKSDPGHVNPPDASWLNTPFDFRDENGNPVTNTAAGAVDTIPLGYDYDDVSDPLGTAVAPPSPAMATGMTTKAIPEMVGATDGPVTLSRQPRTVAVSLAAPTGPAAAVLGAPAQTPKRVFINVENVTADHVPGGYTVHLNDLFAGVLPMFGVKEATEQSEQHPGGGLHYSLDVTRVVEKLAERGEWDPSNARITFIPDDEPAPSPTTAAMTAAPDVSIGRVSVYYA